MKNEMSGIRNSEGKAGRVGLTAATLPWWAKVLIAQHVEAAFPASGPHFINHCADCGCVLISTNIAYQYFYDLCPDCSKNSKAVSKTVLVPKIAPNEDRGCPECNTKNQLTQGGY